MTTTIATADDLANALESCGRDSDSEALLALLTALEPVLEDSDLELLQAALWRIHRRSENN